MSQAHRARYAQEQFFLPLGHPCPVQIIFQLSRYRFISNLERHGYIGSGLASIFVASPTVACDFSL
jgi:hypothetical protein